MTKVKMLEPDTHCFDEDTGLDVWSHSEAQLKQYGDDRAREALEMAAKACVYQEDYGPVNVTNWDCANAIRALAKEIK